MPPKPEDPISPANFNEEFMDSMVIVPEYNKDIPGFNLLVNLTLEIVDAKLLLFSAPSSTLLKENLELALTSVQLPSVCWDSILNLQNHDPSNKFRLAILTSTFSDLEVTLKAEILKPNFGETPPKQKLCFLITCQGTQYPNMAKKAYNSLPIFKKQFDLLDLIVDAEYGFSVKKLLVEEEKEDWLNNPLYVLPSILLVEISLHKLFQHWGISPDYVVGMSFGDYGAAILAGIITFEEGLKMIMGRAKLMQDNIQMEGFLAAEMNLQETEKLLEKAKAEFEDEETWFDIAAINSPKQTCVVGKTHYILKLAEICRRDKIRHFLNHPYHPYHSRLTTPIIKDFEKITSSVNYKESTTKYISTVTGQIEGTLDQTYFLRHLQEPARLIAAIKTVLGEGVQHFLEIGSHPINCTMVQDMLEDKKEAKTGDTTKQNYVLLTSLRRKQDDILSLLNSLGQLFCLGYPVEYSN